MSQDQVYNVNIVSENPLPTPEKIKTLLPTSADTEQAIHNYREEIKAILDRKDQRLFIVVGPCSIHNPDSALKYAEKLKTLASEIQDTLFPIMRVYFEKPRTSLGWKGLINDPYMDDSFHIDEGLQVARKLLIALAEMKVPVATEALDPITPQYIGDLISWTAIGARTTESQTHREMASGLSTPVGFKNGTDGNIDIAINAIKAASNPHHFMGITQQGQSAVFHTKGNKYTHMVLRGGNKKPNYSAGNIESCEKALLKAELPQNIMIDCSHDNSEGNPNKQIDVALNCSDQIANGNKSIVGLMIESNLEHGKQTMPEDLSTIKPDMSITDPCIDWQTTEQLLRDIHSKLKKDH